MSDNDETQDLEFEETIDGMEANAVVMEELTYYMLSNTVRSLSQFSAMHPHAALRAAARLTGELKAMQCSCHNTEESLTEIIGTAIKEQHDTTKLEMMPVHGTAN